ncbi:polysaccharide deacetylase family protein [Candidatus Woesearchaeota archaeon]|nr:polysaccharide deacetylase family protein [Candidatus Woesearchaeota archaeon]
MIYLTFDLEEFSIPKDYGCQNFVDTTEFSVKGTNKLIQLLHKYKVKATFFTTGYFAKNEPALIKKLVKECHEIASHSYRDENHTNFDQVQLKEALTKSKQILEKVSGQTITGFRMPQFSINKFLFPALQSAGYKYDSSYHPAIVPGHYYNIRMNSRPHINKGIRELPISTLFKIPISWVWMRNSTSRLPMLASYFNKDLIIYFHPWEFTKLPEMGLPWYITRNCGQNMLNKVEELLQFGKDFGLMRDHA